MIAPRLPSMQELQPLLDRLTAENGSCVIIALHWPRSASGQEFQNYAEVGTAFFTKDETDALRSALHRAKLKRKDARHDLATPKQGDDSQ